MNSNVDLIQRTKDSLKIASQSAPATQKSNRTLSRDGDGFAVPGPISELRHRDRTPLSNLNKKFSLPKNSPMVIADTPKRTFDLIQKQSRPLFLDRTPSRIRDTSK